MAWPCLNSSARISKLSPSGSLIVPEISVSARNLAVLGYNGINYRSDCLPHRHQVLPTFLR